MAADVRAAGRQRIAIALRLSWTIAATLIVQAAVCAVAAMPSIALWSYLATWTAFAPAWRVAAFSAAAVPSYVLFALCLMPVSAAAMRLTGWRTPPDAVMRIADVDWPLLQWVHVMVATHLVRLFAGHLLRGTPVWTWYLRLCGARIGRRVYVNSLGLSDYNLLDFDDDVVIGADAHIAGHTVEKGFVKTGRVHLGGGVTVGVGSIIDIDVDIGPGCQIGAMSLVPKNQMLEPHGIYVGIPVHRVECCPDPSIGHPSARHAPRPPQLLG